MCFNTVIALHVIDRRDCQILTCKLLQNGQFFQFLKLYKAVMILMIFIIRIKRKMHYFQTTNISAGTVEYADCTTAEE